MKQLLIIILVLLCCSAASFSQAFIVATETTPSVVAMMPCAEAPCVVEMEGFADMESATDKKNDPGYESYKKGYDLILDEAWEEGIKQLQAMISGHPKSQYVDDAAYWIAYAYKAIDEDKAREQYKKFIKNYPKSKYYDDAYADLSDLESGSNVMVTVAGDSQHVIVGRGPGNAFTYSTGTTMRLAERQFRAAQELTSKRVKALGGAPVAWTITPLPPSPEEKLDKEDQLKLDVLYALGDKKDDEDAYKALKEIAIDPKQNRTLRIAAMDQLVEFKKHDPLPVFLEIAKRDTSEKFQNLAIDYIGALSNNKNRSVETLSDLFDAIPKYRSSQLQAVLGSIAEIGNDKAVDFLGRIATKHESYDLRRDAVYYLGSIGNEKARATLLKILKVK